MALDKTSLTRNTCVAIQLSSTSNAKEIPSSSGMFDLLSLQFKTQFVTSFEFNKSLD